jgi:hypothetical protein
MVAAILHGSLTLDDFAPGAVTSTCPWSSRTR